MKHRRDSIASAIPSSGSISARRFITSSGIRGTDAAAREASFVRAKLARAAFGVPCLESDRSIFWQPFRLGGHADQPVERQGQSTKCHVKPVLSAAQTGTPGAYGVRPHFVKLFGGSLVDVRADQPCHSKGQVFIFYLTPFGSPLRQETPIAGKKRAIAKEPAAGCHRKSAWCRRSSSTATRRDGKPLVRLRRVAVLRGPHSYSSAR